MKASAWSVRTALTALREAENAIRNGTPPAQPLTGESRDFIRGARFALEWALGEHGPESYATALKMES